MNKVMRNICVCAACLVLIVGLGNTPVLAQCALCASVTTCVAAPSGGQICMFPAPGSCMISGACPAQPGGGGGKPKDPGGNTAGLIQWFSSDVPPTEGILRPRVESWAGIDGMSISEARSMITRMGYRGVQLRGAHFILWSQPTPSSITNEEGSGYVLKMSRTPHGSRLWIRSVDRGQASPLVTQDLNTGQVYVVPVTIGGEVGVLVISVPPFDPASPQLNESLWRIQDRLRAEALLEVGSGALRRVNLEALNDSPEYGE